MNVAQRVSSGLSALPGLASSFASTQAAWRFFNNPRITLPQLVEPLLQTAREACQASSSEYALIVHDASSLNYPDHTRKHDRATLTHKHDIGYRSMIALMLDAQSGAPIAPVELRLGSDQQVCSTRQTAPDIDAVLHDEILPTMQMLDQQDWDKRLIHIMDREFDSVDHFRQWEKEKHLFLVRGKDNRSALHNQQRLRPSEIAKSLKKQGKFHCIGEVSYKGRQAQQWVAEASVVLDRPGRRRPRAGETRRRYVKGEPLEIRLVITEIRIHGSTKATWFLWTNVPAAICSEKIAVMYYWRWRIETYFKLLKTAGFCLEQWQQETVEAVARRLLVASMAAVLIWRLARQKEPEAIAARKLLVRLSGRQMKYGVEFTAPAMLAGLWSLLSMLDVMNHYSVTQLEQIAATILGQSCYHDSG